MTSALRTIFEKLNGLPSVEQDAIAKLLSDELAWQKSFYKSQKQLGFLAEEAIQEYAKGKARPINLK